MKFPKISARHIVSVFIALFLCAIFYLLLFGLSLGYRILVLDVNFQVTGIITALDSKYEPNTIVTITITAVNNQELIPNELKIRTGESHRFFIPTTSALDKTLLSTIMLNCVYTQASKYCTPNPNWTEK